MNAELRLAAIVLCGSTLATPACAEADPESQTGTTRDDSSVPVAQSNVIDYLFPDRKAKALSYERENFILKSIIAIVTDYTWFDQDGASLAQVGVHHSQRIDIILVR